MDQSKREQTQKIPRWWRDENPGHEGNKTASRFNRRQQKQMTEKQVRELNQRCPGPAFCNEIHCDYCNSL